VLEAPLAEFVAKLRQSCALRRSPAPCRAEESGVRCCLPQQRRLVPPSALTSPERHWRTGCRSSSLE
jgi:hypothetical protein